MTTLVTGATGNLGSLIIDRLIARGAAPDSIVAGARVAEEGAELAALGVPVRRLDYDDSPPFAAPSRVWTR